MLTLQDGDSIPVKHCRRLIPKLRLGRVCISIIVTTKIDATSLTKFLFGSMIKIRDVKSTIIVETESLYKMRPTAMLVLQVRAEVTVSTLF